MSRIDDPDAFRCPGCERNTGGGWCSSCAAEAEKESRARAVRLYGEKQVREWEIEEAAAEAEW